MFKACYYIYFSQSFDHLGRGPIQAPTRCERRSPSTRPCRKYKVERETEMLVCEMNVEADKGMFL